MLCVIIIFTLLLIWLCFSFYVKRRYRFLKDDTWYIEVPLFQKHFMEEPSFKRCIEYLLESGALVKEDFLCLYTYKDDESVRRFGSDELMKIKIDQIFTVPFMVFDGDYLNLPFDANMLNRYTSFESPFWYKTDSYIHGKKIYKSVVPGRLVGSSIRKEEIWYETLPVEFIISVFKEKRLSTIRKILKHFETHTKLTDTMNYESMKRILLAICDYDEKEVIREFVNEHDELLEKKRLEFKIRYTKFGYLYIGRSLNDISK